MEPARIIISARTVGRLLTVATVTLLLTHVGVQAVFFVYGVDAVMGLPQLFNLNRSNNLAAWYSGIVCLAIAGGLGVIVAAKHQARDVYRRHWATLAIGFLGLSFDELTRLHDNWPVVVGSFIPDSVDRGPLAIIVAAALAVALLLVWLGYAPFLRHLPGPTGTLFVTSGVAFLAAALGLEMIDLSHRAGTYTPGSMLLGTLEEGIEMGSYVLFLYALLTYAERTLGEVRVSFK